MRIKGKQKDEKKNSTFLKNWLCFLFCAFALRSFAVSCPKHKFVSLFCERCIVVRIASLGVVFICFCATRDALCAGRREQRSITRVVIFVCDIAQFELEYWALQECSFMSSWFFFICFFGRALGVERFEFHHGNLNQLLARSHTHNDDAARRCCRIISLSLSPVCFFVYALSHCSLFCAVVRCKKSAFSFVLLFVHPPARPPRLLTSLARLPCLHKLNSLSYSLSSQTLLYAPIYESLLARDAVCLVRERHSVVGGF